MTEQQAIPFRAETRQLLDILIHSLYSEREVFLRELISNASDALTRISFEMLTNREVLDADKELAIRISADAEAHTLTIEDSGIGMSAAELQENLGTIAHSGAKEFIQAARTASPTQKVEDMIGQFGVGFYSAFMVAESITVDSRSYRLDDQPARWVSTGSDTYSIEPSEKTTRGTTITIHLKEDALEYADLHAIRQIVRKHSNFVAFPIYIGNDETQANQQTAIWRSSVQELKQDQAYDFYRQLTLDFEPPLSYVHINADAPVQLYALLFIPSAADKGMFSLRKEDGLQLYARKVLIQDATRDLLPEWLRFVQGVVDSEDIPVNVSREMIQNSRLIGQIRKVLTGKVLDSIGNLAKNDAEAYKKFWNSFGRYLKEGVAADREMVADIAPLLRYPTWKNPQALNSLDEYISRMKPEQTKIYYLIGDDTLSAANSPHLDLYRKLDLDVLLFTDPIDAFDAISLTFYQDHPLVNAAVEAPEGAPPEEQADSSEAPALDEEQKSGLSGLFGQILGERISEARPSERLVSSPARLVDAQGGLQPEMQKVYRLLNQELEAPKQVLEYNPVHPLIRRLAELPAEDERVALAIELIYADALLLEGGRPDPAEMVDHIQKLMTAALQQG